MRKHFKTSITFTLIAVVAIAVLFISSFSKVEKPKELVKASNVVTTYRSTIKNNAYSLHIAVGKNLIGKPFANIIEIEEAYKKRLIEKVRNSRGVIIDNLTHSKPFLHREALLLLNEIGREFYKESSGSRIIITSLTRPIENQRELTRTNINASPNISSHSYGVSFDIAYTRFNRNKQYNHDDHRVIETILKRMQAEKKLLVIREKQSACYHITVNKQK
jgi:hypothetical protein